MADQTMAAWIAAELREARTAAGVPLRAPAALLEITDETLRRMETGNHPLPPAIDRYLAAYAMLLGEPDPRVFWQRALDRWRATEPAAPVLWDSPDDLPDTFRRVLQSQLERERGESPQPRRAQGAKRTRRAAE